MGWCTPDRNAASPAPASTPPPAVPPAKDPYEVIKMPKLPDLSKFPLPHELQVFREQCAAGVRQAVAMVTAMEHQLWWERSRRQQAEEDIKVLLGAIEAERTLADGEMQDMQGTLQQAHAEVQGDALVLRADQLPGASKAATVIQKNFRGHVARKDFEVHLKDVLRGVDPELDPTALPEVAQHHISAVNSRTGAGSKGLKAAMQGMRLSNPRIVMRKEVEAIQKRMECMPDAGQGAPDPSLDPSLDIQRILQGSLPASSASVIAALVRRCKELQAALVEACESLQQSRMAEQGLRAQNMKVVELSQVHLELEEERSGRHALQQMVAKLRHALVAQQQAQQGGDATAQQNPHIAGWYRRQYAQGDFVKWEYDPSKASIAGGKRVFAGPEAEVELWDDMRASIPEPLWVPRACEPQYQYNDLIALQSDLAAGVKQGPMDPLYYNPTPDTTQFSYSRDTPIVPTVTPLSLIREPTGGAQGPDGLNQFDPARQPPIQSSGQPVQPMYSVLPLIREDAHMAKLPDHHPSFAPPPPKAPAPVWTPPSTPPPAAVPVPPTPQPWSHPPTPTTPAPQPPPTATFDYARDTPHVTMNCPLNLIRETSMSSLGGMAPHHSTSGGVYSQGGSYSQGGMAISQPGQGAAYPQHAMAPQQGSTVSQVGSAAYPQHTTQAYSQGGVGPQSPGQGSPATQQAPHSQGGSYVQTAPILQQPSQGGVYTQPAGGFSFAQPRSNEPSTYSQAGAYSAQSASHHTGILAQHGSQTGAYSQGRAYPANLMSMQPAGHVHASTSQHGAYLHGGVMPPQPGQGGQYGAGVAAPLQVQTPLPLLRESWQGRV